MAAPQLPDDGFFSDPTNPAPAGQGVAGGTDALDRISAFIKTMLGVLFEETVTLASDTFAPSQGAHTVAAESGTADTLASLGTTEAYDGMLIRIRPDASDTITVKHNTGNILLADGADFVMSDPSMRLWLIYSISASAWIEEDRSYGSNKSAFRTFWGLTIGSAVQAYSAILAAFAGVTGAADKLAYFTGATAMAVTSFTSYARTLLALTDKAAWQAELAIPATSGMPSIEIVGGILSNDATTPNTKINVTAAQCWDQTLSSQITYVGGTLDLTTNGANGLRTGSLANSTNYAVFLISGTSGTALFADTALTPGTRPSGYTTSWRRIGTFRTDGSGHILPFVQTGRRFQLKTPSVDVNDVATTGSANSQNLFTLTSLMTGKKWPVCLTAIGRGNTNAERFAIVTDPDAAVFNVSNSARDIYSPDATSYLPQMVFVTTDTSSRVAVRVNVAQINTTLVPRYWEDDGL